LKIYRRRVFREVMAQQADERTGDLLGYTPIAEGLPEGYKLQDDGRGTDAPPVVGWIWGYGSGESQGPAPVPVRKTDWIILTPDQHMTTMQDGKFQESLSLVETDLLERAENHLDAVPGSQFHFEDPDELIFMLVPEIKDLMTRRDELLQSNCKEVIRRRAAQDAAYAVIATFKAQLDSIAEIAGAESPEGSIVIADLRSQMDRFEEIVRGLSRDGGPPGGGMVALLMQDAETLIRGGAAGLDKEALSRVSRAVGACRSWMEKEEKARNGALN